MDCSSDYKARLRRVWTELLTIRQIAGSAALWRAANYLAATASGGYGRLDKDPFIKAILVQDGGGGLGPAQVEGAVRAGAARATYPQEPQAAWHKERVSHRGLVRRHRAASCSSRRPPRTGN